MFTNRRQFIGGAMALTAFAAPASAAPARISYIQFPARVRRADTNPTYDEPTDIGETLTVDVAGQPRQVHILVPRQGGDAPRPALLLLHGAERSGRSMLDMWQAAADRSGIVLIAPDALGEGWSPDADLLIAALNATAARVPLAPDGVAMFGHSSGGMLAQLCANRLHGPWRVVATHGAALSADAFQTPSAQPVPMRLYTGAQDHLFPPRVTVLSAEALAAAGHPTEMIGINGHSHWYYEIGPWLADDCLAWMQSHGFG